MRTVYAIQNKQGVIAYAFETPEASQKFIDTNVGSGVWDNDWDIAPIEVYTSVDDWQRNHSKEHSVE